MSMRPGVPLERLASIELSTKVLDDEERLESTLLHEMVHAAAWLVDGVAKPPHGECFKKWARTATSKTGIQVTTTHDYEIQYKYAWACTAPTCDFVVKRHSRSVDTKRQCCGKCRGKLIEVEVPPANFQKSTSKSTFQHTPKKKKELSGYNLFVKQQSKGVRERLLHAQRKQGIVDPKVSQSDVMKECGRLWREKNNPITID